MHVLSQHSMQPVICCPLCQDVLSNKMHLQLHLTHLHSVSPDCVEKLLMTVSDPNTEVHITEMYSGLLAMNVLWCSILVARDGEQIRILSFCCQVVCWLMSLGNSPRDWWWISKMLKTYSTSLTLPWNKQVPLSVHQ